MGAVLQTIDRAVKGAHSLQSHRCLGLSVIWPFSAVLCTSSLSVEGLKPHALVHMKRQTLDEGMQTDPVAVGTSEAPGNSMAVDAGEVQADPMAVDVSDALQQELRRIAEAGVLQQFPNAQHVLSCIAKGIPSVDPTQLPLNKDEVRCPLCIPFPAMLEKTFFTEDPRPNPPPHVNPSTFQSSRKLEL